MNLKLISVLAAGLLSSAPAFSAITLDFNGAGDYNFINEYYNGGTNDGGASGTNYGVSFGPDALAVTNNSAFTYYSNAPTPGALAPTGGDSALNFAAGFSGQVSFYYSSSAVTSVSLYSDLNGGGTLLGTLDLDANSQNGCSDTAYCYWGLASLDFAGVAKSIQFGSAASVAGFDNVTFSPVPLPAAGWLLVSALGGMGAFARRQRVAA